MPEKPFNEKDLQRISTDFFNGLASDQDIIALIEAFQIQREVLKTLFTLWKHDPNKLIYFADPLRRYTLDALKERVAMENL